MNRPGVGEAAGGSPAEVERSFGDLIDEVALDAPVSRTRLVRGLAVVDYRARERDAPLADAIERTEMSVGIVYVLPVDEWEALTECFRPVTALAVRETHRRMWRVLVDDQLRPRTDPLVLLSAS